MNKGSTLTTNQLLHSGDYLVSPKQDCYLMMHDDGRLCLYRGPGPDAWGNLLWESMKQGQAKGSYFAAMQGDGHLCVYRQTAGGGQFVWGTGVTASGGAFVAAVESGGNFTVSKGTAAQPGALMWGARNRLRILTYNTHLMQDSNLVVGAWAKNHKPVCFQDSRRHSYIVQKIMESDADIIALQEVWAKGRMQRIVQDVRGRYPFHAMGSDGDYIFNYAIGLIRDGIPDRAAGSGVILLSRHEILNWGFELYPNPTDDEERAASKGALMATVRLHEGPIIRVGMTHAWTDAGGDKCTNIKDLVRWTGAGPGTVLMGDFNIHRKLDTAKMAEVNKLMAQVGAKDSWTTVHGESQPDGSITDDETRNNLSQFFSPMRNTANPDCIDYIYLGSSPELSLRPFRAEVLRDWKYPTNPDSEKWYWVHPGTVSAMPSATVFGPNRDKVCVVTKTRDNHLQVGVLDRATNRWTHKVLQEGGRDIVAHGAPAVVWFADTLHLFYPQNQNVLKVESQDGLNWSGTQSEGFKTSGGLCAIVYRGILHVFTRHAVNGGVGNQVCYYRWDHPDARARWSGPVWAKVETEHNMSAAVLGDRLCLVTKDGGGRTGGLMHVVLDQLDGAWSNPAQIGGEITTGSPGIMAHNGKFEVFYRERDGGGIFHRSSTDGRNWSGITFANHATTDEVCPISLGDKALFFFSRVVNEGRKSGIEKVLYPEESVLYPARALAHSRWPVDVELDASDHYPYVVDLIYSPGHG